MILPLLRKLMWLLKFPAFLVFVLFIAAWAFLINWKCWYDFSVVCNRESFREWIRDEHWLPEGPRYY